MFDYITFAAPTFPITGYDSALDVVNGALYFSDPTQGAWRLISGGSSSGTVVLEPTADQTILGNYFLNVEGRIYASRGSFGSAAHKDSSNDEIVHVWYEYTDTQATNDFPNAIECHSIFAGPGNSTGQIRAAYFDAQHRSASNIDYLYGIQGASSVLQAGATVNLGYIVGVAATAGTANSTGHTYVAAAYGLESSASAYADVGATTQVDTLASIHATGYIEETATVTTYYGVWIETPFLFGVQPSTYVGLRIENFGTGHAIETNGGNVVIGAGTVQITQPTTIATAGTAGTVGTIHWDANFIYVCTATNTWKRVGIATW